MAYDYNSYTNEEIAAFKRLLGGKANLLGTDGFVENEPFTRSEKVAQTDILTSTPVATDFSLPDYADFPVTGAVGTRYTTVRLHSFLPSGFSDGYNPASNFIQSFITVSATPTSNAPEDIQSVRLYPLISPKFSQGRGVASHSNVSFRGFQLTLYPALSGGGVGNPLVADTSNPIPIEADPGAGVSDGDVAPGAGLVGDWTVDYDAGIVRLSRKPLNGSDGIFNPNNIFGDANGNEVAGDGILTLFATFYHYTGNFGSTANTQFVTVGDGYVSTGIFTGENHNTVQAALNSLPAMGGTLFLKEGTYDFQAPVVLPKYTSIVGLDGAIILRPPTTPAFIISDGYNTIQGLEIQPRRDVPILNAAAIEIRATSNGTRSIEIKNNTIYANDVAYSIAIAAETSSAYIAELKILNNSFRISIDNFSTPDVSGATFIGEINTGFITELFNIAISNNYFDPDIVLSPNNSFAINLTIISLGTDLTGRVQNLEMTGNHFSSQKITLGATGLTIRNLNFSNNTEFGNTQIIGNLLQSIVTNNSGNQSVGASLSISSGQTITSSNISNNISDTLVNGTQSASNLVANVQTDGYSTILQGTGSHGGLIATGGTNAPGVIGFGNGTGSGVYGLTSSNTSSRGVLGIATGSNFGVQGFGIQSGSVGVVGSAAGIDPSPSIVSNGVAGAGVVGVGISGAGVAGIGSSAAVAGVFGKGALTSPGGLFYGGATGSGVLGSAVGGAKNGVVGVNGDIDANVFDSTVAGAGIAGKSTHIGGVYGEGSGAGIPGVFGKGDPTADAYGVFGLGGGALSGLVGVGGGNAGHGVEGFGSAGGAGGKFWGTDSTAGIIGTGGDIGGHGVEGFGGTDGYGIVGFGDGSGSGVEGIGGTNNGTGVRGLGQGTAPGVSGHGGGSNAPGVRGTGGEFNGSGVQGIGNNSGTGIVGTGGSNNGMGGNFTGGSSDGYGLQSFALGVGHAILGVGDQISADASGVGVIGWGSPGQAGVKGVGPRNGTGVVGVGIAANGIGGDFIGSLYGIRSNGNIFVNSGNVSINSGNLNFVSNGSIIFSQDGPFNTAASQLSSSSSGTLRYNRTNSGFSTSWLSSIFDTKFPNPPTLQAITGAGATNINAIRSGDSGSGKFSQECAFGFKWTAGFTVTRATSSILTIAFEFGGTITTGVTVSAAATLVDGLFEFTGYVDSLNGGVTGILSAKYFVTGAATPIELLFPLSGYGAANTGSTIGINVTFGTSNAGNGATGYFAIIESLRP